MQSSVSSQIQPKQFKQSMQSFFRSSFSSLQSPPANRSLIITLVDLINLIA